MRGLVVNLTPEQIVARALYLAGGTTTATLDQHVRVTTQGYCPDLYYLLHDHNGGKDPTAPDPADRWSEPGSTFVNRTSDCVGGAAWCSGFDRYQQVRFAHLYDGWINTDSMIEDARGPAKCFHELGQPEPGSMIVCASHTFNHAIGHVGVVVGYNRNAWNSQSADCWKSIDVVNIAAYRNPDGSPARANRRTTGAGWFGAGSAFLMSTMT